MIERIKNVIKHDCRRGADIPLSATKKKINHGQSILKHYPPIDVEIIDNAESIKKLWRLKW